MFGPISKLFVLFISCLILSAQFNTSVSKPCEDSKDCGPGKCETSCNKAKCGKSGTGCGKGGGPGGPGGDEKTCENRICVGKCGKAGCMKNQPSAFNTGGQNSENGDKPPPSLKPCGVEKCAGECRSPGCFVNRPENQKKDDADDMNGSSSKNSSNGGKEPLSGSLDCQKVLISKEVAGPIFTSDSTNPKPYVQCVKCNLQTTPDNSAVILSCYDCHDLKSVKCGEASDDATNGSNGNKNTNGNKKSATNGKGCGSGVPEYKSSGPNEHLVETNVTKNSQEQTITENSDCDSETDSEDPYGEPALVYLVYYIQIANYTDTKPDCHCRR